MSEDTETLDLTTDEALLSSLSEHRLEELELQPYSLLRQSVAGALCGRSNGGLFNAVITVWVCTLREREALEAYDDLVASRIKAFQWGEGRGYSVLNWKPVLDIYVRLIDELKAATQARVKHAANTNGDELPNDGGQPA